MARTWLGSGGRGESAGVTTQSTAPTLGERRNGKSTVAGGEEVTAEGSLPSEPWAREPCQIECQHGWVRVGVGHAHLETPECGKEPCVQEATHWLRSWPGDPPRPPQEQGMLFYTASLG